MTMMQTVQQRAQARAFLWLCESLGEYASSRAPIALIPPDRDLDPEALRSVVEALGLEAMLYQAEDPAGLLADFAPAWRDKAMHRLAQNLKALKATAKLFPILEKAGIPAAAMRGVVLAHRDYASPEERAMRDVDVLLAPGLRPGTLCALTDAGLEPGLEHLARLRSQDVFRLDGVVFELHWALLTAKRYRAAVDESAWLKSRKPLDLPEGRIFTLAREEELLGLVLHAFVHHELTIFKQLLDIALFMTDDTLDWAGMAAWCRERKLSRMFAFSFALVAELFHLHSPACCAHFPLTPGLMQGARKSVRPFYAPFTLADWVRRKGNMLHAAETPRRFAQQLAVICSAGEIRDLCRRLRRPA